eukprot:1181105-Prorocentrum_minimum.AAC.2
MCARAVHTPRSRQRGSTRTTVIKPLLGELTTGEFNSPPTRERCSGCELGPGAICVCAWKHLPNICMGLASAGTGLVDARLDLAHAHHCAHKRSKKASMGLTSRQQGL